MTNRQRESLVAHLERNPALTQFWVRTLEDIIADLMTDIYEAAAKGHKIRLAGLELRARRVLDRWRKAGSN